jgi:hypothetical protein
MGKFWGRRRGRTIIFGVALATTKLNNHCVAAARPTFIALSLALGISET